MFINVSVVANLVSGLEATHVSEFFAKISNLGRILKLLYPSRDAFPNDLAKR